MGSKTETKPMRCGDEPSEMQRFEALTREIEVEDLGFEETRNGRVLERPVTSCLQSNISKRQLTSGPVSDLLRRPSPFKFSTVPATHVGPSSKFMWDSCGIEKFIPP